MSTESTTAASGASLPLPSYFECPVCMLPLADPRILHCFHSVCASCLTSAGGGPAPESDGGETKTCFAPFRPPNIVCPVCTLTTACSSIDALPQNYAVIEALRSRSGFCSCFNCNARDGEIYCPQCSCSLCRDCFDRIHQHRIFSSHTAVHLFPNIEDTDSAVKPAHVCLLISAGKASGKQSDQKLTLSSQAIAFIEKEGSIPVPCPRHASEFKLQFCRNCNSSACPRCAEEEHQGHSFVSFRNVVDGHAASELPEYQDTLQQVAAQCDAAIAAVEKSSQNLSASKDACIAKLNERVVHLHSLLESRKSELTGIISQEYVRKHRILEEQLEQLRSRRQSSLNALWLTTTLTTTSNHENQIDSTTTTTTKTTAAASRIPAADSSPKPIASADATARPCAKMILPPSNQSLSVVAELTALVGEATALTQSQRVDAAAGVDVQLKLNFSGQTEPLERLIQQFGVFYSKKALERKFPSPQPKGGLMAVPSAASCARSGRASGSTTPGRGATPRSGSPSAFAIGGAPYFGPVGGSDSPSTTTGILYFYGCGGGIKKYQNPLSRGIVEVRASSIGYGTLENLVQFVASQRKLASGSGSGGGHSNRPASPSQQDGQRPRSAGGGGGGNVGTAAITSGKEFSTQNSPFSWVSVGLPAPVELESYVLFHDAFDPNSHFLRSWELRGLAVDNEHCFSEEAFRKQYDYRGPLYVEISEGRWARAADPEATRYLEKLNAELLPGLERYPRWYVILDSRRNCDALKPGCPSACFYIPGQTIDFGNRSLTDSPNSSPSGELQGVTRTIPCRRFVLLQTGTNSSGNHHLMTSCIEFFGTVLGDK